MMCSLDIRTYRFVNFDDLIGGGLVFRLGGNSTYTLGLFE